METASPEDFLGVDVGAARVGIARGSIAARLAEPLETAPAKDALKKLNDYAIELGSAGIVVGLPRSLEGDETPQTKAVKQWVISAKAKIDLPFYYQDEALTSQLAEARQNPSAQGADAVAACILLEDFLNTAPAERVKC